MNAEQTEQAPQTSKPTNDMRFTSIGTQAGIFDTRMVTGFLLDIFEKLHEVHQTYQACSEDLERGRANLNKTDETMTTMQASLGSFTETVDSVGVHLLQENATLANKYLAMERIRKDVALKRSHVEGLTKNLTSPRDAKWREQQLSGMRQERAKLELQLAKVNSAIDSTYEEMFATQERLYGIKDLRENRRDDHTALMASLTTRYNNGPDKKRELLTLSGQDTILDMRDVYVSPAEFKQLKADIEILKHKQLQCDRHLEMQNEEKEFLLETTREIGQKVYDLEKQVRNESLGDYGLLARRTVEPQWYQGLQTPTVWFTSPTLTHDQLKLIIERQTMEYRFAHARALDEPEMEVSNMAAELDDDDIVSTVIFSNNHT